MTTFNTGADLNRNAQDSTERHGFQSFTHTPTGAYVKVKGNATVDDEVPVLALGGTLHNLSDNADAEVILIGGGDDTTAKFAIINGPRDKQYQSKKGQSWTQNPMDPKEKIGHTAKGVRLSSDKTIAEFSEGAFEIDVKNKKIYTRWEVIHKIAPVVANPPDFEKE